MTKEKAIQLWKDNDVSKVTFEFNCGGDSMNETQVYIHNSADEEIECSELSDYFDEEYYNNLNFYVDLLKILNFLYVFHMKGQMNFLELDVVFHTHLS